MSIVCVVDLCVWNVYNVLWGSMCLYVVLGVWYVYNVCICGVGNVYGVGVCCVYAV